MRPVIKLTCLFVLLLLFVVAAESQLISPYKNHKEREFTFASNFIEHFASNVDEPLQYKHTTFTEQSFPFIIGQKVSGNLLLVKTVNRRHFQVVAPHDQCCTKSDPTYCKMRTSDNAKEHNCTVAVNGGFFDVKNGFCLGSVVSNDKHLQLVNKMSSTFAFVDDNEKPKFLIGYLNATTISNYKPKISQLLQGVLWLIKDGKSFVNESKKIENVDEGFCSFAAPRVIIGHDSKGQLMILETDGYEPLKYGLNVYQLTDLALFLGFYNAINIDGGGSSTVYIKGYPTLFSQCSDPCSEVAGNMCPNASQFRCERHVTTILCLK